LLCSAAPLAPRTPRPERKSLFVAGGVTDVIGAIDAIDVGADVDVGAYKGPTPTIVTRL